jgi:hypothetical protein
MRILNLFRRAARPHDAMTAAVDAVGAVDFPGTTEPNDACDSVDPERLMPFLRSRAALALQRVVDRIADAVAGPSDVIRALGADLVVDLFSDGSGPGILVDSRRLHGLGLDRAQALERASANLRRRGESQFTTLGPGVFVLDCKDGYASSRLLLPEAIAALPVKGDPVAMVPVREMLIVAGADDKNALLTMAAAAAETLSTTSEPLSAHTLRLVDGDWVDFTPDPDALASLCDLVRGQRIREYAEQKELLDQLHAQEGDDIFVANYAPMQDRRSGRPFCMTFWADGMASLLPQSDVIAFKTATEVIVVPWDAALPIVGHHMAPTEHYPVRLHVPSFPSLAELDRLRAVATLAKPVKTG